MIVKGLCKEVYLAFLWTFEIYVIRPYSQQAGGLTVFDLPLGLTRMIVADFTKVPNRICCYIGAAIFYAAWGPDRGR